MNKFNKGDIVQCMDTGCVGITQGDIFIVSESSSTFKDFIYIYQDMNNPIEICYHSQYFKLVSNKQMNKFKVGDKVVCTIIKFGFCSSLVLGEIYTVSVVSGNKISLTEFTNAHWKYDDTDFELDTSEQMTKFKSGDKVKCIKHTQVHPPLVMGGIYTIKNNYIENNLDYVHLGEVDTGYLGLYSSRFELYKKAPEFDITADISRQFTRDDKLEVIKIHDSGLDIPYPLCVYFKGYDSGWAYSNDGKWINDDMEGQRSGDLVTRPEVIPDVVSYFVFVHRKHPTDTDYSFICYDNILAEIYHNQQKKVFTLTYNPNTESLTTTPFVVNK